MDIFRLDIDECEDSPCPENCVNTLGSYFCTCRKGFEIRDSECKGMCNQIELIADEWMGTALRSIST